MLSNTITEQQINQLTYINHIHTENNKPYLISIIQLKKRYGQKRNENNYDMFKSHLL